MQDVDTLDAYLEKFGTLLGKQAQQSLAPLHVPGRDPLSPCSLQRKPFEAQAHCIEAVVKAWKRQKSVWLVAEMGTGKTIMAIGAVEQHAGKKPYRAMVFCPGQLVRKWEREIKETVHGARVVQLDDWKDAVALRRDEPRQGKTWYIIARDRAKLGAKWRPAAVQIAGQPHLRCPECGGKLVDDHGAAIEWADLAKNRSTCEWLLPPAGGVPLEGCGAQLWQHTSEMKRWEPAKYVHKKLRGFFDYFVLDEAHETKASDSAQGNAAGALAASCRKALAMTGTLIGGYAEHIRPLLFRLCPRTLVDEGLHWSEAMRFSELYGRIETTIRCNDDGGGDDNAMSRGSKRSSKTKAVKPGIMPTLFGRHLLGNAVFLSLAEVADSLPPLTETVTPVEMGDDLARHYRAIEKPLVDAIKQMLCNSGGKDKRLLGTMLQVLLSYPDYPYGWEDVGYYEGGEGGGKGAWRTVCRPTNLGPSVIQPKEQTLIELLRQEVNAGRQAWIFVQWTEKRDVQERLQGLLSKQGFRVGNLRASVTMAKREEWIAKHAPGLDVVISHPRLVETGLDLFDKGGKHNFATLIFYETGYNLFTLRQAARRSWRIGQTLPCRVFYLYYASSLQERAMTLMGRKLEAAEALEGKFSTEGLAAMAGDDGGSVAMALAKSLAHKINDGDAQRVWSKVALSTGTGQEEQRNEGPVILQIPTVSRAERLARLRARLAKVDVDAIRQRGIAN
jgi:hypothetical protein